MKKKKKKNLQLLESIFEKKISNNSENIIRENAKERNEKCQYNNFKNTME